jgi:hypothetical protein
VAHEFKFYNTHSKESLAKGVCNADAGLEMSGDQKDQASALFSYLGEGDGLDGAIGPLMCSLALIVWVLTVFKELQQTFAMARAVFAIPRSKGATSMSLDEEGGLCFDSLHPLRLYFFGAVVVTRFTLVLFLLYYGSLFLAVTVELGDLLLNAVALEFVISIDELLYEVLAPARMRHLIDSARPLPVKSGLYHMTWSGVDTATLASLVLSSGFFVAMFVGVLQPQIKTFVLARDALCAGDVDFVFTVDGMGVPAWSYPDHDSKHYPPPSDTTRNFPLGSNVPELHTDYSKLEFTPANATYAAKLVDVLLQNYGRYDRDECDYVIGARTACSMQDPETGFPLPHPNPPPCCLARKTYVSGVDAGRSSLKTKSRESAITATELWNPTCEDTLLGPFSVQYVNMVEEAMGDAVGAAECGGSCPIGRTLCNATSGQCVRATCATSVKPYCHQNSLAGIRARQLCSDTCGCSSPRSTLALSLPMSGCGAQCAKSGDHAQVLQQLPCEDVEVNDPLFQALLDDVITVVSKYPKDWRDGATYYATVFKQYGCDFLRQGGDMYMNRTVVYPPYALGQNFCNEATTFFSVQGTQCVLSPGLQLPCWRPSLSHYMSCSDQGRGAVPGLYEQCRLTPHQNGVWQTQRLPCAAEINVLNGPGLMDMMAISIYTCIWPGVPGSLASLYTIYKTQTHMQKQKHRTYGWIPHNASFGFLDWPRGVLGQIHF